MILTILGWPLGLFLAGVAAWCAVRLVHTPKHPTTGKRIWNIADQGYWFTGLMFTVAAVADFTAIGLIGVTAGAVIAGVMFVILMLLARPWDKKERARIPNLVRSNAVNGIRESRRDAAGLWRRIAARLAGGDDEPGETAAVVAEHVTTRNIPPVLADPVLGPAPEPAALATAAPVPAPYAALASYIGGFVPEDDQALKMFMQGNAAGECAIADAWHAFADICLSSVGLDPAYVAGILEAGDSSANHASLLAMVHRRFGVVYAAVQEWISAGRQLPHKAREFLTGEAA